MDLTSANSTETRWDYFVSYTKEDLAWAEWIAWNIESTDNSVLLQAWDVVPGSHWATAMQEAMAKSDRTIAVVSRNYLASAYGRVEWQAAFSKDPAGFNRKLVPIRIDRCDLPGVLGQVVHLDLCGLTEESARSTLITKLRAIRTGRAKPSDPPIFPGLSSSHESSENTSILAAAGSVSANQVHTIGFTSDGRRLVAGYRDGTFASWVRGYRKDKVAWLEKTGVQIPSFDYTSDIVAIAGTQKFVANSEENDVCLIDFEGVGAPRVQRSFIPVTWAQNISISADGTLLGASGERPSLWNIEDLSKPRLIFQLAEAPEVESRARYIDAAVSPSGRLFCYADHEGAINVSNIAYNSVHSARCFRPARPDDDVPHIVFSADSDRYLFIANCKELEIWASHGQNPQSVGALKSTVGDILHVASSPRSPLLAISGYNGFQIWEFRNPASPVLRFTFDSDDMVWCTSFSPDGTLLATSDVGVVRSWKINE